MKKKLLFTILIFIVVCTLQLPAFAMGSAALSAGSSLTDFVSYSQTMLNYTSSLLNATTLQDYYNLFLNTNFQQDMDNLINSYYTLLSSSRLFNTLNIQPSSATADDFGQYAWNFIYNANALRNAQTVQDYTQIITEEKFLQGIESFIDSYYSLLYDEGIYGETHATSRYAPAYALRPGVPAELTMKMATRLGPGTVYSEELGTLPQTTSITVVEQVMANDVPWAMVDFMYNGARYRAYTGMKRIAADQSIPWGNMEPQYGVTLQETEAFYGPGAFYARHQRNVPANTQLNIYGVENGYLICDYQQDGTLIRAYVPYDSRIQ